LNAKSIGIENVNKGFVRYSDLDASAMTKGSPEDYQWYEFDSKQMASLGSLSQHLIKKHNLSSYNVIGHADIAPHRKQDPGILFPWGLLHEDYGVGAWLKKGELTEEAINKLYVPKEPLLQGTSAAFMSKYLGLYGYQIQEQPELTPETGPVLTAFRAHFSHNQDPAAYKAEIDERDMLWAWGLVSKYGSYIDRKPIKE